MPDLGDVWPLTLAVRNAAGVLEDGGAVTATITSLADGTTSTPSIGHVVGSGTYTVDYQTVQAGPHMIRWVVTGANAGAHPEFFEVLPALPGYIVSLAAAKEQCKLAADRTDKDDLLRSFIAAATRAVEDHLHEAVVRRTVTETHQVCRSRSLALLVTPVQTVTTVATIDGATTWSTVDLHLDKGTGVVTAKAGTPVFDGDVEVAYVAGPPTTPPNYALAALIIVEHLWQTKRGQQRSGVQPSGYEDTSAAMWSGMGFAIPNRALELLGKPPPMVG